MQRDLLALICIKAVSMFASHAEIQVGFYGVAFIITNHFKMTNSVTTDPLTLTAVSHHAALCRCTSGRYSASPRSHMVQIRDFAGSKDAQSHTRKYFSHQQLHCLLFEVSQMHDFPQIGYVKRNVDEKETCESVV